MNHWLLKTEPETFSVDDLATAPRRTTSWEGVRNYHARNLIRDQMKRGDLGFLYHSSCAVPAIVGIVEVRGDGHPDASAWNSRSPYFDAKSPENKPVWYTAEVRLQRRMKRPITLEELRVHADTALAGLWLLRRGNRLSVMPVDAAHWEFILGLE
jgi:predicted RNA-binding protein with PUA-like domain